MGGGRGREAGPLFAPPLRQAASHRGEWSKKRVKGTVAWDGFFQCNPDPPDLRVFGPPDPSIIKQK